MKTLAWAIVLTLLCAVGHLGGLLLALMIAIFLNSQRPDYDAWHVRAIGWLLYRNRYKLRKA